MRFFTKKIFDCKSSHNTYPVHKLPNCKWPRVQCCSLLNHLIYVIPWLNRFTVVSMVYLHWSMFFWHHECSSHHNIDIRMQSVLVCPLYQWRHLNNPRSGHKASRKVCSRVFVCSKNNHENNHRLLKRNKNLDATHRNFIHPINSFGLCPRESKMTNVNRRMERVGCRK